MEDEFAYGALQIIVYDYDYHRLFITPEGSKISHNTKLHTHKNDTKLHKSTHIQ